MQYTYCMSFLSSQNVIICFKKCSITVKFNEIFEFTKTFATFLILLKISRKNHEISRKLAHFRIFAKIEKCFFVPYLQNKTSRQFYAIFSLRNVKQYSIAGSSLCKYFRLFTSEKQDGMQFSLTLIETLAFFIMSSLQRYHANILKRHHCYGINFSHITNGTDH
jgi:hypothetical protein